VLLTGNNLTLINHESRLRLVIKSKNLKIYLIFMFPIRNIREGRLSLVKT
jgi:hypothetical protein